MRPSLFFDIAAEDKSGRAFSSMHSQVDKSERSLGRMKSQFLAVAAAAATFGIAIAAAAGRGAQQIDEAAKSARRMDASIGAFRGLELAASEAGVPVGVMASEVQNLNRELANIGTSGNADRALSRIGLSARDLSGLDADEKLATIADRVKALGLSSGEASALLRDFGIRNREMALLLLGGGEAIRRASQDIDDYGLALNSVEAGRIEAANDQIARLGLVTQYAGQRLALELVPAMGAFAQAITDSLREGGLLRGVLDGLVDNLDRIGTYASVAVAAFGTRYVAALVAARLATFSLSGALVVLRGALIRTGIGALIVGAGELVYQFSRLVTATGSWGAAIELLGEVAAGVWEGIKTSASSIGPALKGVWRSIVAEFEFAVSDLIHTWGRFLDLFSGSLSRLAETEILGARPFAAAEAAAQALVRAAGDAYRAAGDRDIAGNAADRAAAEAFADAASRVGSGFERAARAGRLLSDAVRDTAEETDGAADAAERFNSAFSSLSDPAGGGGGGGGPRGEIDNITQGVVILGLEMDKVRDQMAGAFADIVTGARSAREAIGSLLSSFANTMARSAFNSLFSLLPIPGFATGTDFAPGGLALVGERGPELVNLPRGSQVIPAGRTRDMLGSGGTVRIVIEEAPGFASRVRSEAEGVAVQITRAGIGAYDRSLPDRVQQIARDPRRRA
jgi:hypothetical protein